MSVKLSLTTGLLLAAFAAAIAWDAPALAGDRCTATAPAGTSLDIWDQKENVIGAIESGRPVVVQRYGEDRVGRPWAYVATPGGKRLGWIYREFISCS